MKALRYLLIVIGLVSFLSVGAQGLAQQPEARMKSTSVLQGSGSTLPMAATDGVTTTQSSSPAKVGPRRVGENEGFEDEEDPDNPGEPFPIGDAMLPLVLLALAYAGFVIIRKKNI